MTSRQLIALAALAALTACGTTVPVSQQVSSGQAGLGGSSSTSSAAPDAASTGTTTPGSDAPFDGSTSTGSTASGSAPADSAVPGAASDPGSTGAGVEQPSSAGSSAARVTTPITIGFLNTGSNAALAAGFGKKGTSVTWEGTDNALIRYYNKHGGIAGRQIKPVFYTVQTTSSSFVNDTQAACAKFTQDNHVDLVMTTAGTGSFGNYESCLDKAKVVNLEAYDQGNTDLGSFAKYPGLFTASAPNVDHAITATLAGLVKSGYITTKNKIGVIVEDCPYNLSAYNKSYAPLAKRLGITVVRRDVDCVDNAAGLGGLITQGGNAVLPFRSAGVDRISFVSDFESVLLLGLSDQAQSQGWKPGYALTSASHAGSNGGQLSQPQLPQMVGVGNLPNVDLTSRGALPPAAARCRQILKSEGVVGSAPADYSILDTGCDIFGLLSAGLTKSNGSSSTAALIAALKRVGRLTDRASVVASSATYGPNQRDGGPLSSVFAFQQSCACFRYTTSPAPLP